MEKTSKKYRNPEIDPFQSIPSKHLFIEGFNFGISKSFRTFCNIWNASVARYDASYYLLPTMTAVCSPLSRRGSRVDFNEYNDRSNYDSLDTPGQCIFPSPLRSSVSTQDNLVVVLCAHGTPWGVCTVYMYVVGIVILRLKLVITWHVLTSSRSGMLYIMWRFHGFCHGTFHGVSWDSMEFHCKFHFSIKCFMENSAKKPMEKSVKYTEEH